MSGLIAWSQKGQGRKNSNVDIKWPSKQRLTRRERPTSGVISFTAKPVPPVVITKLKYSSVSDHCCTARWISMTLSGTILTSGACHWLPPSVEKVSVSTLPDLSVDGSLEAVSEITRTAGLSLASSIMANLDQGRRQDHNSTSKAPKSFETEKL